METNGTDLISFNYIKKSYYISHNCVQQVHFTKAVVAQGHKRVTVT